MRKLYNSVPDLTLLGSVLLAWLLDRAIPMSIIPSPFTLAGWLVAAMSFVVAVRVLYGLRLHGGSTDVVGMSSKFVRRGPYAFSRNPFYLLYVLVAFGVALGFGSIGAFAAPVLCFVVLNYIVIPVEERNLEQAFGKDYVTYKHTVRRWL